MIKPDLKAEFNLTEAQLLDRHIIDMDEALIFMALGLEQLALGKIKPSEVRGYANRVIVGAGMILG